MIDDVRQPYKAFFVQDWEVIVTASFNNFQFAIDTVMSMMRFLLVNVKESLPLPYFYFETQHRLFVTVLMSNYMYCGTTIHHLLQSTYRRLMCSLKHAPLFQQSNNPSTVSLYFFVFCFLFFLCVFPEFKCSEELISHKNQDIFSIEETRKQERCRQKSGAMQNQN